MILFNYKQSLLVYALIVLQLYLTTGCNTKSYDSKHQDGKTGFLGLYLDTDYSKVKSIRDSLLNISELHYFETEDILGNKQKNLYCDFSEISPSLYAKINLRGTSIIDERLTSIQLTLCNSSNTEEQRFSYDCDSDDLKRLFELYREEYGKPVLLSQGEQYDWLSKRISDVYYPGPKGRWIMDKIYYWERGNYIIYFDFGYPKSLTSSGSQVAESDVAELPDSTSAPIIYYDFTPKYFDKLLVNR